MARGRLAVKCPGDTVEDQLYAVPASTEIDAVLRICNKDTLSSKYSVAHCAPGHGDIDALATDWLYFDKSIMPNTTIEISIHAGPTETIRIKSGTANILTYHLSGNTKVAA